MPRCDTSVAPPVTPCGTAASTGHNMRDDGRTINTDLVFIMKKYNSG